MKNRIGYLIVMSIYFCLMTAFTVSAEEMDQENMEYDLLEEVLEDTCSDEAQETIDALAIWLEAGQVNEDVYSMQVMLSQLGYYDGTLDGDFGSYTEAAVIRFQQDNGLYVDGIVGDLTMDKLEDLNGQTKEETPMQPDTSAAVGTDLTIGTAGTAVTEMQTMLTQLGYYDGYLDGDFGSYTEEAVIRFQRENGLYVDGVVGPLTMNVIKEKINAKVSQTQDTSKVQETQSSPITDTQNDLVEGMTGEKVLALQKQLNSLGYKVLEDGDFGSQTAKAVKTFQRLNGLYVDGVVGPLTVNKLTTDPVVYTEPEAVYDDIVLSEDIAEYMKELVDRVTTDNMSAEEKLHATYSYIADRDNYPYMQNRIPYYRGEDWPVVYAHDMMYLGGSYCHGYSALFGYAAVLSGYEDVHWAQNGYHAWVDIDGYIYDPVFRDSSYATDVYGWSYDKAISWNSYLGAGYEYLDSSDEGTYCFIKAPQF